MGIFLIVSEVNLFRSYFARHWPMLSVESGFVFLGLTMIVLGFNILGNLNKNATSQESLGLPMWRIVIASGILSSLMGFFNIVAVCISFPRFVKNQLTFCRLTSSATQRTGSPAVKFAARVQQSP
jgi:glucan phosphoethanolaminetransferase (alkaline phosphatase superfamily)